jgi:wyosine [tRNA(Phe)-imidazoG37] synthetase (radical SAM superfamily)
LDAYDEASFRKVNRPHGKLHFDQVYEGLKDFSQKYSGQLWIEIMLVLGLNDDEESLLRLSGFWKALDMTGLYQYTGPASR